MTDILKLAEQAQQNWKSDIPVSLLERLSKTLTNLGYATPEGGMEAFGADIEMQLYNLCRGVDSLLKGAAQAQQTTEPLGFQIRRAIAAEDELRATKQTLEHAYAALQKVADAQAAIEEPGLLWREIADCVIAALGDRAGILSLDVDAEIEEEIRQEVADTIQAGVRAGMAQQSQDAKLVDGNGTPIAYLYTLEYGGEVVDTKVSTVQLNYPFGVCGADYLRANDDGVSYVRQTKLTTFADVLKKLPGGRATDKWESARVADYNQGWNDYRKQVKAAIDAAMQGGQQ